MCYLSHFISFIWVALKAYPLYTFAFGYLCFLLWVGPKRVFWCTFQNPSTLPFFAFVIFIIFLSKDFFKESLFKHLKIDTRFHIFFWWPKELAPSIILYLSKSNTFAIALAISISFQFFSKKNAINGF